MEATAPRRGSEGRKGRAEGCRDSSPREARRRERPVVCQQPPVVPRARFGDRRQFTARSRRNCCNRGEPITPVACVKTAKAIVRTNQPDDRYPGVGRPNAPDVPASTCCLCDSAAFAPRDPNAIVTPARAGAIACIGKAHVRFGAGDGPCGQGRGPASRSSAAVIAPPPASSRSACERLRTAPGPRSCKHVAAYGNAAHFVGSAMGAWRRTCGLRLRRADSAVSANAGTALLLRPNQRSAFAGIELTSAPPLARLGEPPMLLAASQRVSSHGARGSTDSPDRRTDGYW
jgi:hypothetical protein